MFYRSCCLLFLGLTPAWAQPVIPNTGRCTGVEPDVKVPAAEALATAQKLAMEKLSSK
jgi:hypothetical protein